MTKAELRSKYLALRAELGPEMLDDLSLGIANKLLELNIWDLSYYHIFLPIKKKNEVNTEYIINILAGKDKNIVLPKTNFKDCSLNSILLTDNTKIKSNIYGIPEPIDGIEVPDNKIEVVFVPLLAFDKVGNRVGYGKGFYDRFLAQCKPNSIKIGLSMFEAEAEAISSSEIDVRLDYCVTPDRIYMFG